MNPRNEKTEYLVIGSGAGGAVAANLLASQGCEVLIAEEGRSHSRTEFTQNSGALMRLLYRQAGVIPIHGKPAIGFAEGRCVGGTTVINGGLLWRTPEWILDEWASRYPALGRSWFSHFPEIERTLHVRFSNRYENETNRDSWLITRAADQLGWKVVDVPRALRDCQNLNRCATGCPSGAKQSMAETYLPKARFHGARVLEGTRIIKLNVQGGRIRSATAARETPRGPANFEIEAQHYFLAAGAVQSPLLVRRSGLHSRAGRKLAFHLNLKFLALFEDEIDALKGTIFTSQIQQFEREGLLLMASNWQPEWITATASHFGQKTMAHVLANQKRSGIYVAQIRARTLPRIHPLPFSQYLISHRFHSADLEAVRNAIRRMGQLLFAAGAREIYLPVQGTEPLRQLSQLDRVVTELRPEQLELISVHAMSSCAMGDVADFDGRLPGVENLVLCDASLLPSNIGESPQGTIMALSREVTERHLSQGSRKALIKSRARLSSKQASN